MRAPILRDARQAFEQEWSRALRKHIRRGPLDGPALEGGVPVDPNRPSTLSGGAAATLAFDD